MTKARTLQEIAAAQKDFFENVITEINGFPVSLEKYYRTELGKKSHARQYKWKAIIDEHTKEHRVWVLIDNEWLETAHRFIKVEDYDGTLYFYDDKDTRIVLDVSMGEYLPKSKAKYML